MFGEADERRTVVDGWDATYPDPIVVEAGDALTVLDRESEWDGWSWCVGPDGREGWVPESILARRGDEWVAGAAYSAVELSVVEGETVVCRDSLAGWMWCENASGEEGWVPSENLSE